jgi:hypothetical protein
MAMRFARAQFNIRSLMGMVAVAALLVGGAILLLRYFVRTKTAFPSRTKGGVIMEGVDINWRPTSESHVPPRNPLLSEPRGGRLP